MSKKKVDVRTMPLTTDPKWAPVTMFAVNLLAVDSHTHGNKRYYKAAGPDFIEYGDAVELFRRVTRWFNHTCACGAAHGESVIEATDACANCRGELDKARSEIAATRHATHTTRRTRTTRDT